MAQAPPVLVVSVDHGLRPEAADEARLVAANAARLGLPWRIMQARAHAGSRQFAGLGAPGALRLSHAGCARGGFDTIVTAHHQDDQAETFLLGLRAARASMASPPCARRSARRDARRPPAAWCVSGQRSRSIASREAACAIVADPSNADPRFDRVGMRALMPALAEHGSRRERLAETAGRLGRAAEALDHYVERSFLRRILRPTAFGVVSGVSGGLGRAPEEVALRALARILKVGRRRRISIGFAKLVPAIEALRDAVIAGTGELLKRTLPASLSRGGQGRWPR